MAGRGGRPKGTIKKSDDYDKVMPTNHTKSAPDVDSDEKNDIRDAISDMLTGNLSNLKDWLTQIGQGNPEKALAIFKDFTEYVLPKQQRTDSKDDRTSPIVINFEPSSKANIQADAPKDIPTPTTKKFNIDEFIKRK